MALRNALGAIALDATVAAGNTLLTSVRDAVQGVLTARSAGFTVNGTISAVNGTADGTTDLSNYGQVRLQVTGSWSGNLFFQVSNDGVNWNQRLLMAAAGSSVNTAGNMTGNGSFYGDIGGKYFRVFATSWTSGTATVTLVYTALPATVVQNTPTLQTSTNHIGRTTPNYTTATGTVTVNGAIIDGTTDIAPFPVARVQITGTYVATLQFETSIDGTNWANTTLIQSVVASANVSPVTNVISSAGIWGGVIRGRYFRVRCSAFTSGTATVTILYAAAPDTEVVHLGNSAANIGTVYAASGTSQNFSSNGTVVPASTWKGGTGTFYGLQAYNPTASPVYVKVYNKATAPAQATDTPMMVALVPATNNGFITPPNGVQFMSAGIQVTVTGGAAHTDTTVPGAGVLVMGAIG